MAYHLYSFKNLLKKRLYKIFLLYFLLNLILVLVTFLNNEQIIDQNILMILGIGAFAQNDFLFILWTLFQYLTTAYMTVEYIYFDANQSLEFTLLRFSNTKNILLKFIVLITFCILFRTLVLLITFLIFHKYIFISFSIFVKNTIYHLILIFIIYLLECISKFKR